MTKQKEIEPITWFQFNNLVPIITSTVLIIVSFFSVKTEVEVLKQKVDTILAQQSEILGVYKTLSAKQNDFDLRLSRVETLQSISK